MPWGNVWEKPSSKHMDLQTNMFRFFGHMASWPLVLSPAQFFSMLPSFPRFSLPLVNPNAAPLEVGNDSRRNIETIGRVDRYACIEIIHIWCCNSFAFFLRRNIRVLGIQWHERCFPLWLFDWGFVAGNHLRPALICGLLYYCTKYTI
jgi:hypothetical protein